jgi:VanZ family protein
VLSRSRTLGGIQKYIAYAPAVFWAAGLLYLGSRTFEPFDLPDIIFPSDKIAHLVLYGILGLLSALGWRWAGRQPSIGLPLAAALAVGALDELQQRGIPARTGDIHDWLVDALAIVIAFIALGRPARPVTKVQ